MMKKLTYEDGYNDAIDDAIKTVRLGVEIMSRLKELKK